jgi:hypothetical protein
VLKQIVIAHKSLQTPLPRVKLPLLRIGPILDRYWIGRYPLPQVINSTY